MILGIDPGLANTGWAVLENSEKLVDSGCLITKSGEDSSKRLAFIYNELEKIIVKYKVEVVSIESLFFAKNAKSALPVAEAIGVVKICGMKNRCRVVEYTPLQIKMALVGYGRAEKDQVEVMVRQQLVLDNRVKISHEADAMAAALTELFTMKI
ncbi:crossover junction endodeoxyribonuclease RuvC [Patescibacteria group bacterium]|nr:crossover junction endodeoxyribonuclease RuvC [Patescibacteria group bacterium]